MKKYRTFTVIGLMAALLLSACSQDELAENTALPEGEYPLQIGSVTLTAEVSEQPWTRVSENPADGMSSVWQGDEQIGVQIGSGQPGIYTVQADGSVVAENPVYLSNQSNGLAYVLNATQDYVSYEQSVTLNFTHKLAKVRVVLDGSQAEDVTNVEVYNYTKCRNILGTVVTSDTEKGWLKMKKQTFADGTECWEANVVPGEVISQIKVNNTEATLTKPLTPKVAALNTITINVEQAPTEIDLDAYEGTTLTVSGKTTIKGNGQQKNLQITVAPDTELTLQNVNLSYKGSAPVVFKGDATLTLEGANTLEGECVAWDFNSGSGIYIEQGTLTINADNENASLTISRKYNMKPNSSAGMGICVPENASLIIKSGKITINDVDSEGDSSGAGIGTSGETCGNITIEGGNITVGKCSWYTAGIGSLNGDCKGITITGENTVVNVSKGDYASCYIGSGIGTVTGNITIGDGATLNGVKYTETHTGTL